MNTIELIEKADKDYKPFPSFEDWPKENSYEEPLKKQVQKIEELKKQIGEEELKRGHIFVKAVAAIDTGAIEGLYESDRGSTFAIALNTAMLDSTAMQSTEVSEKYRDMESYLNSQLKTYDLVLDLTTKAFPITEAHIRQLHSEICEPQKKYKARMITKNEEVIIEKDLKHGQYKHEPNHVRLADGSIHSYAPVYETKPEMERLVKELNSDAFKNANPVVQASYAHYAFVSIHPFSDGNGRVARALSSIFTYRHCTVPYLVLVENKLDYFKSLSEADKGNYLPFIEYTYRRIFDAINLVIDSFRMAPTRSIEEHLAEIDNLYKTGGYTYEEVDQAGLSLLDFIGNELINTSSKFNKNKSTRISIGKNNQKSYPTPSNGMRSPVKEQGLRYTITLHTIEPAHVRIDMHLYVEVPVDADKNDEITIREPFFNNDFTTRLSDVVPKISATLIQRVEWYTNHIIELALERLSRDVKQKLIDSGYR